MTIEDHISYIHKNLDKPVIFIGMMGAGKTTAAKKTAEALKWGFIDSDHEIEKDEGISVREIFETKGEPFFRELEKNKIADLLTHTKGIISIGGGAITTPETAEALFSKALCIWLDAPVDVLVKRVAKQGSRPLLNGRDAAQALEERMEQRKHLYSRAHIHIDASPEVSDVVQNVIGQIYNYLVKQKS